MVSHLKWSIDMAIIVDKIQKRRDIALSCKVLFFQNGIKDLTISQVAKTAGVGKGTIYDYFKNKEDIVFEIVNILMQEHNAKKEQKLLTVETTKEKIKVFFSFFYNDEDIELRQLYKEFVSISLLNPDPHMIAFHSECSQNHYNWFKNILQEGIDKGELIEESLGFARGIFTMGEGMFIFSSVTNTIDDLEKEIAGCIDSLFELLEVKDV